MLILKKCVQYLGMQWHNDQDLLYKTAAKRTTKEMKGREKEGGMRMKERFSKYGLFVIVDSANGYSVQLCECLNIFIIKRSLKRLAGKENVKEWMTLTPDDLCSFMQPFPAPENHTLRALSTTYIWTISKAVATFSLEKPGLSSTCSESRPSTVSSLGKRTPQHDLI